MIEAERPGLERQQGEIQPAQRAGQLAEIVAGPQRHILHKRPEIAADQRAENQIHRQRKDAQRHAHHPRHNQVMHRVNAQRFQRLDFAHRPGGAQFDHVGRADARQHQQRRHQRAQFAHDHDDHDGAQVIDGADAGEPGNRLADDHQPQRRGHKRGTSAAAAARRGHASVEHPRADHLPRDAEAGDHHPQRDQGERAQALQREQKTEQPPPQITRQRPRQRQAQQQPRARTSRRALAFPFSTRRA